MHRLDSLKIYNIHCSNKCKQEGNTCLAEGDTIKVSLFQRTEYT